MKKRRFSVADVAKKEFFGLYRGVVEYNVDPQKRGRCKVRVVAAHGTEKGIDTAYLPWAEPILPSGGGFHDGGSFSVPPVGATVWVQFEQGDPQFPVYQGSWLKNTKEPREYLTKTSPVTGEVLPERPVSSGEWLPQEGPESPVEVLATPYEPTTHVVAKSVKGHTLLVEDRDGFEVLRIIDRAGQEIRLSSPVSDSANEANALQRGTDSVIEGESFDYGDFAGGGSTVEIVGTHGQGLKIFSKADSEFFEIQSNDPLSRLEQNRVRLLLGGGLGTLEIRGVRNGVDEVLLSMDLHSGHIEVFSTESITMRTRVMNILAEMLTIKADVFIDGNLYVKGNAVFGGKLTGTTIPRIPPPLIDPDPEFPTPVTPTPPVPESFFGVYAADPADIDMP